jgi:hypothetical protein
MEMSKFIQKRTFSKIHQLLSLVHETPIYQSVADGSKSHFFEICASTVRLFDIVIIEESKILYKEWNIVSDNLLPP